MILNNTIPPYKLFLDSKHQSIKAAPVEVCELFPIGLFFIVIIIIKHTSHLQPYKSTLNGT